MRKQCNTNPNKANCLAIYNPINMKKIYLLAAGMLGVVCSNAQIVHTDFGAQGWHIPIDSDTQLDVDADGQIDFTFNATGTGISILPIFGIGCSSYEASYDGNGNMMGNTLILYNDGETVGSNDPFDEGNPLPIWDNNNGNWGDWVPNEPAYTGIMMWTTQTFGWMRIEFDVNTQEFILYEFALQMTSNTPILVGDRGLNTGFADRAENAGILVYPNPAASSVTVTLPSRIGATQLEIIDMSGRIVHTEQLVAVENAIIEVAQWEAGNYFVRWITATGIEQQMLTVQ